DPGGADRRRAAGADRKSRRRLHFVAVSERLRLPAGIAGADRQAQWPVRRARTGGMMAERQSEAPLVEAPLLEAPLLEARGLSKSYGGLLANNNVKFSLAPGQNRRPIGPHGAGQHPPATLVTGL